MGMAGVKLLHCETGRQGSGLTALQRDRERRRNVSINGGYRSRVPEESKRRPVTRHSKHHDEWERSKQESQLEGKIMELGATLRGRVAGKGPLTLAKSKEI